LPISNQSSSQNETRNDSNVLSGARKLIRPQLSQQERRRDPQHHEDPLSHALISDQHGVPESSHAEVFYFQKQMQQQTEMTVVLEDGEEVHGVIQWFDKAVVKMRVGRERVMIYKSAIKYMYKGSEAAQAHPVMK